MMSFFSLKITQAVILRRHAGQRNQSSHSNDNIFSNADQSRRFYETIIVEGNQSAGSINNHDTQCRQIKAVLPYYQCQRQPIRHIPLITTTPTLANQGSSTISSMLQTTNPPDLLITTTSMQTNQCRFTKPSMSKATNPPNPLITTTSMQTNQGSSTILSMSKGNQSTKSSDNHGINADKPGKLYDIINVAGNQST